MPLHTLSVTYMKPFRQDNTTYFAWNRRFNRTMYWQQSMSHTWQNGSWNTSHIDKFLSGLIHNLSNRQLTICNLCNRKANISYTSCSCSLTGKMQIYKRSLLNLFFICEGKSVPCKMLSVLIFQHWQGCVTWIQLPESNCQPAVLGNMLQNPEENLLTDVEMVNL